MTTINRRNLVAGGLGAGLLAAGRPAPARAQAPVNLTLSVWGAQAEQDAFNAAIAKYQAQKPNVSIRLEVVPIGQFYQQIDTRLAGRQAPDLFRIQYPQIGKYASAKAILDLTPHLEAGYGDAFAPALWKATSFDGKPFALPHHTDTFALYYNADYLKKVGVEAPTSLDKSWTWPEFIRVAKLLKEQSGAPYAFAMSWQNSNAYRWMMYLHQHGGQLLDDDLKSPRINSPAGIETIAWTQSWFKEGLVPPSTSLKSSEQTQNLFANGTVGMLLNGNWQIPYLNGQISKFGWGVTYMPRDVAMASDLGGNGLAISRDTKNRDVAADVLKFLVNEENMRSFITAAQFLPARKSLSTEQLDYKLKPELMKVFVEQATTVPDQLARTIVLPSMSRINQRMADELDLAFTSGQTPEATARNIEAHVKSVLGA